jgi:glycosyltransferase involved in cell wall biosynthesis
VTFDLEQFRSEPLPSQAEVMADWNNTAFVVSVICFTYNQEKYIHDAIRGFLIQKTKFAFEIIIHDDASSDSTPQSVQAYAETYPKIIKPIFQKENQYSKSPNSIFALATKGAMGEYLAFCEGDDFWISPEKLQLQIEFLQKHHKQNICFHDSYSGDTEKQGHRFHTSQRKTLIYPSYSSVISPEEVIIGDGGYMPSASIVITRAALNNLPKWYGDCPVGDYFMQVLCSHPDGALFLPQLMSFYRVGAIGSWSEATMNMEKKKILHYRKMTESLNVMDRHLKNEYAPSIIRMQINGALHLLSDRKLSLSSKIEILELAPKSNLLNILSWLIGRMKDRSPVFLQNFLRSVKYFAVTYKLLFFSMRNCFRKLSHHRENSNSA